MTAQEFAYCRVSTGSQSLDRQIDAVTSKGVPLTNVFTEKVSGVVDTGERIALQDVLSRLRPGDTLWLDELSRLGRTMSDVVTLVHKLTKQGIRIRCASQPLDTGDDLLGPLIVSIMAWLAEIERKQMLERQAAGRRARILRGQPFGRPHAIPNATIRESIVAAATTGASLRELARAYGVSKSSIQRYVAEAMTPPKENQ